MGVIWVGGWVVLGVIDGVGSFPCATLLSGLMRLLLIMIIIITL